MQSFPPFSDLKISGNWDYLPPVMFVGSLVKIITKRAPKIMILPPSIMLVGPKTMKCSPVVGSTGLDDLIT